MGRKSALTPEQWAEIDRRILLGGESVNKLAAEFGVNESSIRRKVKPNKAENAEQAKSHPELRALAERKVAADTEVQKVAEQIAQLPIATQRVVVDLADDLRAISSHLAGAARFGAATAHRLSGIAHAKVQEIDDAAPLDEESLGALKGVAVLTRMANDASTIGVNLLAANKDRLKEGDKPDVPAGLEHFYGQPG
jgi:transposase-like protein